VLGHAFIKGDDPVAGLAVGAGVVKDADDGGVAALEDADNAAHAAAVGLGGFKLDQHLVALHGAVDFVGGMKMSSTGEDGREGWRGLGRTNP